MNRLAHWMMQLYPSRWRRRYGDELDALLADTGADVRIVADLLRGGVRMQFKTWSFAKSAVGLGFAGLLLAGVGSLLWPSEYVSQATVRVQQPGDVMARLAPLVLSRSTLSSIINDPRLLLYMNDLKTKPLEEVIENMRRSVRIDVATLPGNPSASAFNITFEYPDARKAQQTLAAIIERFRETSADVLLRQPRSPQEASKGLLEVVDVPNLPVWPIHSNIWVFELGGALFGVSAVLGWRKLRKRPLATWRVGVSAIALGMLGFLGAVIFSEVDLDEQGQHLIRAQYQSTAMMSARNTTPAHLQALFTQALSRTSLSGIINDPRLSLYKNELKTKPLEDVIEEMRRHLSILAVDRNVHYFNISFEYQDRFKAQQTVAFIMNGIDEANQAASAGLPGQQDALPANWGQLSVQEGPTLDNDPVWPNRPVIAALGGAVGVFLAAIVALFRNRWKPDDEIPIDAVNG